MYITIFHLRSFSILLIFVYNWVVLTVMYIFSFTRLRFPFYLLSFSFQIFTLWGEGYYFIDLSYNRFLFSEVLLYSVYKTHTYTHTYRSVYLYIYLFTICLSICLYILLIFLLSSYS